MCGGGGRGDETTELRKPNTMSPRFSSKMQGTKTKTEAQVKGNENLLGSD